MPLRGLVLVLVGGLAGGLVDRLAPTQLRAEKPTPLVEGRDGALGTDAEPERPILTESERAIHRELDAQYRLFEVVDETFARVSRGIAPSVVHIVARKEHRRRDGETVRIQETGSGVIVRSARADGLYVLTNNHVVLGARPAEVLITFQDEERISPDRIWTDAKSDVAVLALPDAAGLDLIAARMGDSDDLDVGHWVLAVGSPFGLNHSVSQGIISARGRYEPDLGSEGVLNQDFLQTDAAINPGNSGGPLVNMRGEVVGINTAIASNGGGNEGVGFSIPINLARWVMNELIDNGLVTRGAMGVSLDDVNPAFARRLGLTRSRGALVLQVYDEAPAARAGIRERDVILRFNGVDILNLNHLINVVSMAPIGQPAEVELWRDGRILKLPVEVQDRTRVLASESSRRPDRDEVSPINPSGSGR